MGSVFANRESTRGEELLLDMRWGDRCCGFHILGVGTVGIFPAKEFDNVTVDAGREVLSSTETATVNSTFPTSLESAGVSTMVAFSKDTTNRSFALSFDMLSGTSFSREAGSKYSKNGFFSDLSISS